MYYARYHPRHSNGSELPCPAHRSFHQKPSNGFCLKTFYSRPTPPLRLLNHLADNQAPGTNPAAAVAPALFLSIAIRVSWLEDVTLRFGHSMSARQSTIVTFQDTSHVSVTAFRGQNIEAAPLPIHGRILTLQSPKRVDRSISASTLLSLTGKPLRASHS
jgi:hypothetical protein